MSPDPDPPKTGARLRYREGDVGEFTVDFIVDSTVAFALMRISVIKENDLMPYWDCGDIIFYCRDKTDDEDCNALYQMVIADNGAVWRKALADDPGIYEGFIRTAIVAQIK